MTEFGLNDIGNTLILTVEENDVAKDISDATAITYLVKKPDEITIEVTAAFNTTGVDGKVVYTFIATNLDQVGLYDIQVKIVSPTWTGISSSYLFTVRDTLVVTV